MQARGSIGLKMLTLPGAIALSDFRIKKLLAAVRSRDRAVDSLTARFIHFVQTRRDLTVQERAVLEALLVYGPRASDGAPAGAPRGGRNQIIVIPRPGTISPWSSKATDIAHVCGLDAIERIERGVAWEIAAASPLSAERMLAIAPALYDRMTESAIYDVADAAQLFVHDQPRPFTRIPLLTDGRDALVGYFKPD